MTERSPAAPWPILEFERSIAIRTGNGRSLVHVSDPGFGLTETHRADARLIAAAPLLLEALREAADVLARCAPDVAVLARARRAIDEASGAGFDMRLWRAVRTRDGGGAPWIKLTYDGAPLAEFPDEMSFDKDEGQFTGLGEISLQERARAAFARRKEENERAAG